MKTPDLDKTSGTCAHGAPTWASCTTMLFPRKNWAGLISILNVDMAADIFTKPVEKAKFIRMRDYIMNVHSSLRGSIEDAMTCAVGASHRMMTNLLRRL